MNLWHSNVPYIPCYIMYNLCAILFDIKKLLHATKNEAKHRKQQFTM